MGRNGLGTKFCFPILYLSHPILARNKAGMMFFNFLNFYTIFLKFSKPGWVGMDSEQNFFFLILSISRPILARNKAGMMFLYFLTFYTIFLKISKPGWLRTDLEWNFVVPFSAFLVPFWQEIKLEWCFLIFWIFILFFWNYLNRVGSEWTQNENLFFSHSQALLSRFG